jgi:hypothetical protein
MLWPLVEFLLFVASSGVLFNEQFRKNHLAVSIAGCIALTSFYFLAQTVLDKFGPVSSIQTKPLGEAPSSLPSPLPGPIPAPGPTADEIFWLTIKDTTVAALYEEFVRKFPTSAHAVEARKRLEDWKKATIVDSPTHSPESNSKGPFCIRVNGKQICE